MYERFVETASALLHAMQLNYRYHEQLYNLIEVNLAILKVKEESLFNEYTARFYAYLLVLSLGNKNLLIKLKEGEIIGHQEAFTFLEQIENKFYEYGNHLPQEERKKEENKLRGWFNFYKSLHRLATDWEGTSPEEREKFNVEALHEKFVYSNFDNGSEIMKTVQSRILKIL